MLFATVSNALAVEIDRDAAADDGQVAVELADLSNEHANPTASGSRY